jgi:hypothetical protein
MTVHICGPCDRQPSPDCTAAHCPFRRADLPPPLSAALALPEIAALVEALEAIYEICVEPAETDNHAARGWIEVTALAAENASLRATRADELARAWEMGRDAGADEYRDGEGPHDYFADAETAIRALRPPADLADRVKGGER